MKTLIKKTSLLLLVCMAAFAFTGCSDDDDGPGVDDTLAGTWEIVSSYEAEYEGETLVWSVTDDLVGVTVVLGQDGSVTWKGRDIGTWAVAGSTFYLTNTEEDGEPYTETYTLTRESSSRITFAYDETYTDDGRTYRLVETFTMERVGGSSGGDTDEEDNGDVGTSPAYDALYAVPTTDVGAMDGVSSLTVDDVIGTWKLNFGFYAYYVDGGLNDTEYLEDEDVGDILTLYEDGRAVVVSADGTNTGTWTLNGSQIIASMSGEGTFTYTVTYCDDAYTVWRDDYYETRDGVTTHVIMSWTLERVN